MKNTLLIIAAAAVLATVIGIAVLPIRGQTGGGTEWTPYTATYAETISNPAQPEISLVTTESRSSDGSLLSVTWKQGQQFSGRLWRGCGDEYSLNFSNSQAVYLRNSPRIHGYNPNAAPAGSSAFGGVACTLYPIGVRNGTGSLCLDVSRDLLVREEVKMTTEAGNVDQIKELTGIDFSKPAPDETIGVPQGLQVLSPRGTAARGCPPL